MRRPCRASPPPPRASARPPKTTTCTAWSAPATTHPRPASVPNRSTTRLPNSPGRNCTWQRPTTPPVPCPTPSPEAASTAWGGLRPSTRSKDTLIPRTYSGTVIQVKVRVDDHQPQAHLVNSSCWLTFKGNVITLQSSLMCAGVIKIIYSSFLLDNGSHVRGNHFCPWFHRLALFWRMIFKQGNQHKRSSQIHSWWTGWLGSLHSGSIKCS